MKTMNKANISFLVLALGLLAACTEPFSAPAASDRGSITISFSNQSTESAESGAQSRTIMPALPDLATIVDTFELTLTSQMGFASRSLSVDISQASASISDLEFGIWDISVIGKKASVSTVSGSAKNQSIASGESVKLTIAMVPIQSAGGTGNVSLAVNFPQNSADALSCRIEKTDGTIAVADAAVSLTDDAATSTRNGTFTNTGLASGCYVLVLSFTKGGVSAGVFRESLNVWDGYTSDKWLDDSGKLVDLRTFKESEFMAGGLSNLVLKPALENFTFAPSTTSYDLGTTNQASISFSASPAAQGQSATYSWNGGSSTALSFSASTGPLVVAAGQNSLVITVSTPGTSAPVDYTITLFGTKTTTYTSPSGMQMVQIPGGSFQRDATATNTSTVSSFLMGKYLVTQEQYQAVVGTNPSTFKSPAYPDAHERRRPVETVSWYDAVEFCNKLSILDGLSPVYTITGRTPASDHPITSATVSADMSQNGYRLPTYTESVWTAIEADSAAPGATNTTGYTLRIDNASKYADLNAHAWTADNASGTTHPVGEKLPNALGLYDLFGQVSKWGWDVTSTTPPIGGLGATTNYQGTVNTGNRILFGGDHTIGASIYTTVYLGNSAWPTGQTAQFIGFRVVRNGQALYPITYYGNGASSGSPPSANAWPANTAGLRASSSGGLLVKDNYLFNGWSSVVTGSGTTYLPGASLPANTKLDLYPTWWAPAPGWAYCPSSGSAVYETMFNDVAVDSDGNAYAVGYQYNPTAAAVTFKYESVNSTTNAIAGKKPVLVKYNYDGTVAWACTITLGVQAVFKAVALDPSGNIYVVGYQENAGINYTYAGTSGSASFTNGSTSAYAPVLLKFTATGSLRWLKPLASNGGPASFWGLAIDSSGQYLYACGTQGNGSNNFGDASASVSTNNTGATYGGGALLVKYDISGSLAVALWAKTVTTGSSSTGSCLYNAVAIDSAGAAYAVGTQNQGISDFGDGVSATVNGTPNARSLIVKYAASGTTLWAKTIDGPANSQFQDVACSGTDAYICGYQYGTGAHPYGALSVTGPSTGTNGIVAKYNATGDAVWVKPAVSGTTIYYSIAVDAKENVLLAGRRDSTAATFYSSGPSIISTSGNTSCALVVSYTSAGRAQWAQAASANTNSCLFYGLASQGNQIYAVGYQYGTSSSTWGSYTATGRVTDLITYVNNPFSALIVKFQ